MGVKGLWDILKQYSYTTSLAELSVNEGVLNNVERVRGLRVGIDASIWIYAASFHTRNEAQASLFTKVMRLLSQTAIIPLFVFDGPERPHTKRHKTVRMGPHWLVRDFKILIVAAGYEWITAPGEAEAELAWLCRDRFIDYVLTEDVDVALFGAPRILRILEQSDKNIMVQVYRNMGHSVRNLVLIALFAGGDYDDGLPRCGIRTAEVLADLDISQRLVWTVENMENSQVPNYLQSWRSEFEREIKEHPSKTIRALSIPAHFPSAHNVLLYLRPITSQPAMPPLLSWDTAPNLRQLASFASRHLTSCDTFKKLMARFSEIVFPGLAIRDLLKTQLERDNLLDGNICPYRVLGPPLSPRIDQAYRQRDYIYLQLHLPSSIVFDILTGGVDGGLDGDIRPLIKNVALRSSRVWIPRPLYELVMNPPDGLRHKKVRHRIEARHNEYGEEVLELITDSEGEY